MEGVKRLAISQPNDCNEENSEEKAVLENLPAKNFSAGARGRA